MARLAGRDRRLEWRNGEGYREYDARTKPILEEIQRESERVARAFVTGESLSLVGFVYRSQVADGYAMYRVAKDTPLTFQHLPWGDAYEIHPAMLRGLRRADIEHQIRWYARFESRGV